jgi:hypothetical protein
LAKTRQDKTRQDKAEQGKTSKTRQGKTRQDKARQDKTRQDKTRQGKARQDKARQGKARQEIIFNDSIPSLKVLFLLICGRRAKSIFKGICLSCLSVYLAVLSVSIPVSACIS